MYSRRARARQKREQHRTRAAQFQEMHRKGARPYHAGGNEPIAVSFPLPASAPVDVKREVMGLRYPIKAYVV
jgi:hypothetical protein